MAAPCTILLFLILALTSQSSHAESTCFGTTSNGRLENSVQLPASGGNYEGYSTLGRLLGRTYVHSAVAQIMEDAFTALESQQPGKVYKYAETGLKNGGEFKPHKTHQNGLSVDFMVPFIDSEGSSVHLPTHPLNKFGYNIEFDSSGTYGEYRIDYEAMAAHIVQLHVAAVALGFDLWRVIFDPELQPALFATKYGPYLRNNIEISEKRSWVRHDEHYHIDFSIPCENES